MKVIVCHHIKNCMKLAMIDRFVNGIKKENFSRNSPFL